MQENQSCDLFLYWSGESGTVPDVEEKCFFLKSTIFESCLSKTIDQVMVTIELLCRRENAARNGAMYNFITIQ